jgi:hypothetical protein
MKSTPARDGGHHLWSINLGLAYKYPRSPIGQRKQLIVSEGCHCPACRIIFGKDFGLEAVRHVKEGSQNAAWILSLAVNRRTLGAIFILAQPKRAKISVQHAGILQLLTEVMT